MAHLFGDPEFWVLLAVAIFLILVWKPLRRTIVGALDARAARIRGELAAAANLREEAQQALAAYQRELTRAVAASSGLRGDALHKRVAELTGGADPSWKHQQLTDEEFQRAREKALA